MRSYLINIIVGILLIVFGLRYIVKVGLKKEPKKMICWFSALIVVFYVANVLFSIIPFNGLNLINVTPISNISPFLFSLVIVSLFTKGNVRQFLLNVLSIFNISMFIAGFSSSLMALILGSFYFTFSFFDMVGHVIFGLFSIYLLLSGEVVITKKKYLISCCLVLTIPIVAVILNLVFKTQFFGLTFDERFNIYGLKLGNDPYLSLIFYFAGLLIVLAGEYFINRSLSKIRH